MPDAPKVYIRVVNANSSEVENVHDGQGMIGGMCVDGNCSHYYNVAFSPDMNFYVTHFAHLFDDIPPLSPAQEAAVQALNHLMDEDYWLKVAHANGVNDDEKIRLARQNAQTLIWNSIAPNRAPQATQFTNFMGTDCQVF